MKKVLSLLLVTAMSLSLLAGCGGGDGNSSKSNGGANPSTSGTTVDTSNRKDLVICMPEEIETFDPISTSAMNTQAITNLMYVRLSSRTPRSRSPSRTASNSPTEATSPLRTWSLP